MFEHQTLQLCTHCASRAPKKLSCKLFCIRKSVFALWVIPSLNFRPTRLYIEELFIKYLSYYRFVSCSKISYIDTSVVSKRTKLSLNRKWIWPHAHTYVYELYIQRSVKIPHTYFEPFVLLLLDLYDLNSETLPEWRHRRTWSISSIWLNIKMDYKLNNCHL